jgi:uncharacterized protein YceH (UPF0502 family)
MDENGKAERYTGTVPLTPQETRVLGCLLEKQRVTPDVYPLSLNSLRAACNQSTNRDPVVQYDEATIREAIHRLERRGFARLASGAGSRAAKYRHLLAEALPMDSAEQAVMCVLMLRGPQTPGELKQRTERMHAFADLGAVHETLARLIERRLVERLERRPGQKEERYAQLLEDGSGEAAAEAPVAAAVAPAPRVSAFGGGSAGDRGGAPSGDRGRAPSGDRGGDPSGAEAGLTERVARLEREVAELRALLAERSTSEL